MKTYEVKFNDYGNCFITAKDYHSALRLFEESKYGGEDVRIKSVTHLFSTNESLFIK